MAGRRFNRSLRADGRWCTDAGGGQVGWSPPDCPSGSASMPHKNNANGRHHIPKMQHAAANWAEYEGGLRRRGSLTLWITEEAIAAVVGEPPSDPGRSGHLFRQCDPDLPDAASGVQAGFAPSRRVDAVGRGTAGLRARRSRPHDRQPTGGATGIDHSQAAARLDRRHRTEGVRRWSVAGRTARSLQADMAHAAPRCGRVQRAD